MKLQKAIHSYFKKDYRYKLFYLLFGVFFILWMLFWDTNSLLVHQNLNKEIKKLKQQKKELQEIIEKDQMNIDRLSNIDSLERFAREYYMHKKDNETIFIVEPTENTEKKE